MKKQFVNQLQEKVIVESLFLVRDKNRGVGKTGKAFISAILGDNTGSIDARIWDKADELGELFSIGDIIKVKANVQVFQNRKQLILQNVERIDTADIDMSLYLEKSKRDAAEMYIELFNLVKTLKNDSIRNLILNVITDPEIKPKLLTAPAAKSIHHAWIGGLLEHILSISKIMDFMASHYANLNRDLLIFGAIFHDIGKLWELSYENGINYTDKGRLIGHMGIACELIDKKAAQILGFDEELRDILKHIVLSHHGKLEYGSPKRPKFMEAMLVAMVDDLDSKIATIDSFMRAEKATSTDRWSKLNNHFERYFLLDDFNEKL